MACFARQTERSGGQKGKRAVQALKSLQALRVGGEPACRQAGNFCPPSLSDSDFFAAAEFRASETGAPPFTYNLTNHVPTNKLLMFNNSYERIICRNFYLGNTTNWKSNNRCCVTKIHISYNWQIC